MAATQQFEGRDAPPQDELNSFFTGLSGGQFCQGLMAETPEERAINAVIENDKQLIELDFQASKELAKERKLWEASSSVKSARNPLEFASRINTEVGVAQGVWFRRLCRYLNSPTFRNAWEARRHRDIARQICGEVLSGAAVDKCLRPLIAALEKVASKLVHRKAAIAGLALLQFFVLWFLRPKHEKRWFQFKVFFFPALTTAVTFLIQSAWVAIPVIFVIDDFEDRLEVLSRAGEQNAILVAAFEAFMNIPVIAVPVWILSKMLSVGAPTREAIDAQPIQGAELFCHDSFCDSFGSLCIIQEPRFVHGYQTERETAERLLESRLHPITRRRLRGEHVLVPSARYLTLRAGYIARRNDLIQQAVAESV